MSHILFEQLENAGFIRGTSVNSSAIERASPVNILDVAQESCELTSAKDLPQDKSVLAQSASLSLGCARWPCSHISCRMNRAQRLANFAALYGDRVYIRNLFADYMPHAEEERLPDESTIRAHFAEDLRLLAYLRPLIEAKKILPITPPNYCFHHLTHGLVDENRLRKVLGALTKRAENEIEVSVSRFKDICYVVEAHGPPDLLEHGASYQVSLKPPRQLEVIPRIAARVRSGQRVKLSKWALRKTGYASALASPHQATIVFELSLAQCLHTGFLTEMPLHVEILKHLSLAPPRVERDLVVEKHLTCLVPFLKELSPTQILKLREKEEESFIVFRAALAQAIDEYRRNYGAFGEADARALYADVLRPRLAELETTVGKARRSLAKGSVRKVLAWGAAVSFGVYAGFLPQQLAEAAAAFGLTAVCARFAEDLMTKSDIDEAGRGHSMYFLWKMKRMAR